METDNRARTPLQRLIDGIVKWSQEFFKDSMRTTPLAELKPQRGERTPYIARRPLEQGKQLSEVVRKKIDRDNRLVLAKKRTEQLQTSGRQAGDKVKIGQHVFLKVRDEAHPDGHYWASGTVIERCYGHIADVSYKEASRNNIGTLHLAKIEMDEPLFGKRVYRISNGALIRTRAPGKLSAIFPRLTKDSTAVREPVDQPLTEKKPQPTPADDLSAADIHTLEGKVRQFVVESRVKTPAMANRIR